MGGLWWKEVQGQGIQLGIEFWVTCQYDVEDGSRRGDILSKGPELFEGQCWHQVGIVNTKNDRVLLSGREEHIQCGCGEIEF